MTTADAAVWWRTAVIYQIYPRSFADATGDGIGDLPGITSRLDDLAELGVDAIWLSPFYTSPQLDAGYDVADFTDVDPLFGTIADFDTMLAKAHALGLKVIVDIVPNHTSSAHAWFQEALTSAPGSRERERYIFRDGRGADGSEPPNNWTSVFGGPGWSQVPTADGEPGQWYLHLFDSSQPDLDWTNEEVRAEFDRILRFWLDRGVDGFRVDVAHGLVKEDGLPDIAIDLATGSMGGAHAFDSPYWGQEGVHDIWRRWRSVLEEYEGDRILTAEAWVTPLTRMAKWVRSDEMHQAFNFPYLEAIWDAGSLRTVIDESLAAFGEVGAPSTWVLSNHDTIRHPTRLAIAGGIEHGIGVGPRSEKQPDVTVEAPRGRAATLLMLALPGSAYLYQGEELGLPEVLDLPEESRQDPTWIRTGGERYGRDGCRVPLPWNAGQPAQGFSATGQSWLPQPDGWDRFARDVQREDPDSSLTMYRQALALRREFSTATASLTWIDAAPAGVLGARIGALEVYTNLSDEAVALPSGEVAIASGPLDGSLPPNTTVWIRA